MVLTPFQRRVCRILAGQRLAGGEAYVAGGAALNQLLGAPRVSRDLDLFHDTAEAVARTWEQDRAALAAAGLALQVLVERAGFIRAVVAGGEDRLLLEWARESAFRFFPLLAHEEFGLALQPFDLATNKVLALAGRLEIRDWLDVLECAARLQPLGYLAWAACGKDPGFSPASLLAEARRANRFAPEEFAALAFAGPPPDPAALSRQWRGELDLAEELLRLLPAAEAGRAVLAADGRLYRGEPGQLARDLARGAVRFHPGRIGGAWPAIAD